MDPTIKAQQIENVKKAISNIKNCKNPTPSLRTDDFCTNASILVNDWQYDKTEKVKSWLQIYDIQGNMALLLDTILNPLHLPTSESDTFKEDIKVITDFIEFIR